MQNRTDFVHGWRSADPGRGAIDVAWSCLITIFLCVWTAIHLPVPPYTGSWQLSRRAKLGRSNVVPALISVIAPESLAFVAVIGFFKARRSRAILRHTIDEKMSLAHGFFLDMGGFCLKLPAEEYHQISCNDIIRAADASTPLGPEPPPIGALILSEGAPGSKPLWDPELYGGACGQNAAMTGPLSSSGRLGNSRGGPAPTIAYPRWFDELKLISEEQVHSSAKTDALTKLMTCMQALWFASQVISRLFQHRAVTPLEVSTLAYVFCAVTAYAAWWNKPQGCTVPMTLSCTEEDKPSHREATGLEKNSIVFWGLSEWLISPDSGLGRWGPGNLLFVVFGAIFGAIHVASWNIALPSDPELWLWRASSLYCLVFGLLLNLIHVALYLFRHEMAWTGPRDLLTSIILWVYCILRVYLLVEIFASLRSLPSSAYEFVQWSTFVPHI